MMGFAASGRRQAAWEAWGEKPSEKLGFTHPILIIRFVLCVLLALDFNDVGFLCAIYWVYNGWRLSAGDDLVGGPSII